MKNKGQTGLEYLLLVGGIVLLIAIAIVVLAGWGKTGTEDVNKGTGSFNIGLGNLEPPSGHFEAKPTTTPLTQPDVNFYNYSYTDINKWVWNFGDGNTYTFQDPGSLPPSPSTGFIHKFTYTGIFTVALEVTDKKFDKGYGHKDITVHA